MPDPYRTRLPRPYEIEVKKRVLAIKESGRKGFRLQVSALGCWIVVFAIDFVKPESAVWLTVLHAFLVAIYLGTVLSRLTISETIVKKQVTK